MAFSSMNERLLTRDLSMEDQVSRSGMAAPSLLALPPVRVVPTLEALVVPPTSPLYQEAGQLQEQRFARAARPGPKRSYLETVDFQYTIPLVIRRRDSPSHPLVGTALLELAPVSVIAEVIHFQPDSPSALTSAHGTFAEIRGLATSYDLDWQTKLDLLDTLGSLIVLVAQRYQLESLWLVARLPLMGLLLADIPAVLPPYDFTLCPDVLGWNEGSERLQQMRQLRMKALPISSDTIPPMFHIAPAVYAQNIARRLALRARRQEMSNFSEVLQAAMRRACQDIQAQLEQLRYHQTISTYKHVF